MPTAMSAKQIAQVAYNAGWRGEQLVISTAVALAESGGRYWVVNHIGCVGLWQINVPVHIKGHPSWTTAAMKDPNKNAAAAMVLYKDRGWKPWEVYTGPDGRGSDGPYHAQMGRARMAVAQVDKSGGAVGVDSVSTGAGAAIINASDVGQISGTNPALLESVIPQLPKLLGPLLRWYNAGGGDALGEGLGSINPLGPLGAMAKAFIAISLLTVRSAAWIANPRNWLRVVEVLGGAAALFIGLKMLANNGVGGPVGGAVRGTVQTAEKAVKAVQKSAKTAAVATPVGRAAAVASAASPKG